MLTRMLICILCFGLFAPISTAEANNHCDDTDYECTQGPTSSGDQSAGGVVTDGVSHSGEAGSAGPLGSGSAGECSGCEWAVAPACSDNLPGDEGACRGAVTSCPAGEFLYRVYVREGPDVPWRLVDTVCLGVGERPPSVPDVGQLVRQRVVNLLPDAAPSFQPAQGAVVNLPTIFAAGQSGQFRSEPFDVVGFRVVVTAQARWEWEFDRGVREGFAVPGGRYPDDSVSYTYTQPGQRAVSVTTYWRAWFTVDGQGPFAVPGPEIAKTAGPIRVPVREAHSVLVGG